MVLCEQFIFTSSKAEDGGYEVTSKSSGISTRILNQLEDYLYPIGIEPSEFDSSKSMRVLDDKIAFIQSKNVGVGLDGRPDTMFSHVSVIDKGDFLKFENDSRIFNLKSFDIKKSEHLTPLKIEHVKLNPDFTCIDIIGIIQFKECLKSIFKSKKIAIINVENQKLIQSLLSLVPISFRLLSFSTLTPQPEIQTKFDIIQTSAKKESSLNKYTIIDQSEPKHVYSKDETIFEICLDYLIEIIDKKNTIELKKLYDEFESILTSSVEEKLTLVIGSLLLESNKAYSFKQEILISILTIIGRIPTQYSKKYWKKIRDLLTPEEYEKYAFEFEIDQIINEHKIEKITLDVLLSIFFSLKNNNSKTRQKLLQEFFKRNTKKFQRDGRQLLIDANHSIYRKEIQRLYIETEILNPSILEIFMGNDLTNIQSQSMYHEFVRKSSKSNPKLALELLSKLIFDFKDEYETKNFKHLLKESYENILLTNQVNENEILCMVNNIFEKIKSTMEFKPKSGTKGITKNNLEQLIKIIKILQKFLNYNIEKTQVAQVKKRNEKIQLEIKKFVTEHPIVEEKPKRWLFWDMFFNND